MAETEKLWGDLEISWSVVKKSLTVRPRRIGQREFASSEEKQFDCSEGKKFDYTKKSGLIA